MAPQLRRLLGLALAAVPVASACSSQLIYVSSYAGTITTLNLTGNTLEAVSTEKSCAPQASWLALNKAANTLYCLDEAWDKPNGTLFAYKAGVPLTLLKQATTPGGPVSTVFYGEGGKGIAVAEYSGGALSSYHSDPASLAFIQSAFWTMDKPGPIPDRQEAPHPHQAIVDPTGQYLLVPDLGADLVRIFSVDKASLNWTPVTPLTAPPGSGPRHAVFLVAGGKTFMYLVSELANTVTGYEVAYNKDGLAFKEVYMSNTHGPGGTVPAGTKAAEIALSPDNKFLIVSSRLEGLLKIPNFDPKNSTQIPSDPLMTFSIDGATGKLALVQTYPAGGMNPRQFAINKAGNQVAVGLQGDGRVVVIDRDVATGMLKSFVANANVAGEVTCAIFDE